ncbi:MAG: tRNA dihydrouridine synthase DusB [Caulobacterales bacterium 32-69-10]|nr:MAG: tRNA dihydrouridine synthase DusB [Caulobacterales bacterium 32-69-10]
MTAALHIGDVVVPGRVLAAPMTGITDLPFRRLISRLGGAYVATEMVACAELAQGRPDAVRRAAVGDGLPLMVVQLVGRDPAMIARGAEMAQAAGAHIVDLNMGCPAKEVTGSQCGSALMRELDLAERVIAAAVGAVDLPVTLKMRLGWDEGSKNAPELAALAQGAGVKAITVHGRTRQQFYTGVADWAEVAKVRAATSLPLIVNGDITCAASARRALSLAQADAVMIGRGVYGRPWMLAGLEAALTDDTEMVEPGPEGRLEIVLEHMREALAFYREGLGLKVFRKHLGWYVQAAPWPADAQVRREAKARLCRMDDPRDVEDGLTALWTLN